MKPVCKTFFKYSLCSIEPLRSGGNIGDCSTNGPYGQYFSSQQGLQTRRRRPFQSRRTSLSDSSREYPRRFFTDSWMLAEALFAIAPHSAASAPLLRFFRGAAARASTG